jgi:hypothetical protein
LNATTPESKAARGAGWWSAALISTALPALNFFWLQNLSNRWFPASAMLPQTITSGVMTWAVGNALLTVILVGGWHLISNQKRGARLEHYGLEPGGTLASAAQLAVALIAFVYGLLTLTDFFFKTDFRFWIVALKLMSPLPSTCRC